MTSFTITRNVDVSTERMWSLLSDFTRSPVPSFEVSMEEQGDPETNGIGAIRVITIGNRRFRERLESINPPNRFTYRMLSGAPVKEYVGVVEVTPQESATLINWAVTFAPKIFGTGWIIKRIAKRTINLILDEMAAEYG